MKTKADYKPFVLFEGGKILTGKPGEVIEDAVLLVEEKNISYLGSRAALSKETAARARLVSLEGCTLMPGLIDAHLHLWGARTLDYLHRALVPDELSMIRAVKDAEALIDAGFTTVREAGGNKSIHLRKAVEEGTIKAPRILSAHKAICITGGHYDPYFLPLDYVQGMSGNFRLADGSDECRKAVREQVREGADFIKICTTGGIMSSNDPNVFQFSHDELKAIVEEAHVHGKRVAAHAYGRTGIMNALRSGVDSIEHGTYLDEEIADEMVRRNVFLVPTLSIMHSLATEGAAFGAGALTLKKAMDLNKVASRALNVALRKGIRIASGTDFSGCPPMHHGENALELSLMVRAGMPPLDAIVSGTHAAAEALGIGDWTGTLEVGKRADLLVVKGDPLANIDILRERERIRLVLKEGSVIVERSARDANSHEAYPLR
jgi:imidazolonepropionase-like amidohydrolase